MVPPKIPIEGSSIVKVTSVVGIDGRAMLLAQMRPVEGASIMMLIKKCKHLLPLNLPKVSLVWYAKGFLLLARR